ncbi:hypothetical protein ACIBCN_14450 [Nocardia sp. NPDC051052]|uniref:hypothetical protein n=1 Tax=Nocardia sp. NPDC051052 TaxID=3364322 RepID=UPI0037B0167E
MSSSGKSLEYRVHELERWRDQQITRDTVTVTGFEEKFDAVHASLGEIRASIGVLDSRIGVLDSRIGDLDGRSVASRLISMSIDIGNLLSRQESMETRQGSMETRQGSMEAQQERMGTRLESMESDVGYIKSDVAQILHILRKPNGDK